MIYVEHYNGPEQTDAGRIDWQPGWYAICDDCGWMAGPCLIEADAHAAADAHDLAMGEVTLQELGRGKAGERLQVAWQASHGRRPEGWWLAVEVPGRPRVPYGRPQHAGGLSPVDTGGVQGEVGQQPPAPGRDVDGTVAAGQGQPTEQAHHHAIGYARRLVVHPGLPVGSRFPQGMNAADASDAASVPEDAALRRRTDSRGTARPAPSLRQERTTAGRAALAPGGRVP